MTTILPFPHLDQPAPRAWLCHCGKRSVGVACWNCRQERAVGEVDGSDDSQKVGQCASALPGTQSGARLATEPTA